jgi:protocatechuate 3,4-dioxygenase beta subunit
MIRRPVAELRFFAFLLAILCLAHSFISIPAMAQSTIATGSIQGTILDSSGAAIPAAKITIRNKDTGQTFQVATSSSGAYTSGAIVPGNYSVRA